MIPTAEELAETFRDQIRGKNVLITGVSPRGLGAELARILALFEAGLIVCTGRTESKVKEVFSAILKESPNANFRFLSLDLASLKSCRAAAAEVLTYQEDLDFLVGNSGVMNTDESTTADGFETQWGINHLGHFLFLNLLVPKLLKSIEKGSNFRPRIIVVSSLGHTISDINYSNPGFGLDKIYSKWAAYGQSKTGNALYALCLSRKLEKFGVLAYSLHPGAIDSEIDRHMTLEEKQAVDLVDSEGKKKGGYIGIPFRTASQGVANYIYAMFSPEITEKSGYYIADCKMNIEGTASYAKDPDNAERCWKISEEMVGQKFDW